MALTGFLLFPVLLNAQFNNNTTSPFSRFGLGDLHGTSFGRTAAMGGATLGSRNPQQINIANPASYTSTDSMAFLFEFGVNGKFSSYKNKIGSFTTNDVNFRYFAFSLPVTRWMSTALGLTPYSDVGYDIQVNETLDNTGAIRYIYYGEGSLSKAFWGLGIKPFNNFSVGANFYYLFGSLTRNANVVFPESSDFYTVQKNEMIRLRDIGMTLGVQYTSPLKNNQTITIGATMENKAKFTGFHSDISLLSLLFTDSNNQYYSSVDTISHKSEVKDLIRMPLSIGAGISYVRKDKLEINADYNFQGWSDALFFGKKDPLLANRSQVMLGGEYIPEKYSIRSYVKRVAYRAGITYDNSCLVINNQRVNDFGISFGVGLPVYRSNSTINIAAELGRRGTTKNNLIRENYAKLNLSVNLYDIWFVKRKFD